MATYNKVTFDEFSFRWYCKELLDKALYDSIISTVSSNVYWVLDNGGYVNNDINSINTTHFEVGTENAKAFLQEYGSGQYMLDSNPYLSKYKKSNYWNPLRKGKKIVGREYGYYTTPNWETGIGEIRRLSLGNMAGITIPIGQGQKPYPRIDSFLGNIYSLFLEKIDSEVIPKVQSAVNNGQFITVTTEKG